MFFARMSSLPPSWIMGTTLEVGGKAYNDSTTETRYSRLPAAAKGQVREIV